MKDHEINIFGFEEETPTGVDKSWIRESVVWDWSFIIKDK